MSPTGTPDDAALWRLIGTTGRGVLATVKRDGRPQLSTVDYLADPAAGLIRFSTRDGLAKVANLRRDPRASLHVARGDGSVYAVAEASVELTPQSGDPADATVEELVDVYRGAAGEHPDWDEYRTVMVADRRLVVRLHVDRIYGYLG
jgi:PPOX class probable F420-dependent enzyme